MWFIVYVSLLFVSEMAGKENAQRLWPLMRCISGPSVNSFNRRNSTGNSTRLNLSRCCLCFLLYYYCRSVWFIHSAWVVLSVVVLGTLDHASMTTPESEKQNMSSRALAHWRVGFNNCSVKAGLGAFHKQMNRSCY